MGDESKVLILDSRRRCSLAKFGRAQDVRYLVDEPGAGVIVLTPADLVRKDG